MPHRPAPASPEPNDPEERKTNRQRSRYVDATSVPPVPQAGGGVEYGLPPQLSPAPALTPSLATPAAPSADLTALSRQKAAQGDALYHQQRFAERLSCTFRPCEQRPDIAHHHFRAGMAAWQAGRLDAVEAHLREAVRLAPPRGRGDTRRSASGTATPRRSTRAPPQRRGGGACAGRRVDRGVARVRPRKQRRLRGRVAGDRADGRPVRASSRRRRGSPCSTAGSRGK